MMNNNRFKPQMPKTQKTPKMQTTTLWDFPSQHYGEEMQGDADYIGATPSYVIWNLLHRYTKPGAVVIDPFCGSGTTLDVCKDLDRRGLGFDIAPTRPDIQKADARHIPLEDASADFVFIDPPYSTHVKYSGDKQCIGELDARGGGYYEAMEDVIADIYRVLKPGGYFALYVSDSQAKNKAFCPIGFELFLRMTRLFEPVDVVCVTRHNKSLKRNHWHTSAIEGNYFLRGFNYLFIVRKRPLESEETHKHEEAGILSKLFEAAAKASPGEVVTPEKFGQLLDNEKDKLQEHLSKKQQKKLNRARAPQRPQTGGARAQPSVSGSGAGQGPIKPKQQPAKKKGFHGHRKTDR
jgi:DNA modification methylase